jgi:hypothetical protein
MRGAGVCDAAATGGAVGRGAVGGAAGGADAVIDGAVGGGATTAAGGGAGRGGTATGGAGGVAVAAGFSTTGATTAGRGGRTTGGVTGAAGGGVGLVTGGAITGLATIGGAAGRVGAGATASFCCVIALSTSPGREMCERSILVLISSSPRNGRAAFAAGAAASDEPRRWARTLSASCSSRELECVFFSVTPTMGSTSRMALLLTSSSLARSLIRTLLIRPFFSPSCAYVFIAPSRSQLSAPARDRKYVRARHDYSVVSGAGPLGGSGSTLSTAAECASAAVSAEACSSAAGSPSVAGTSATASPSAATASPASRLAK